MIEDLFDDIIYPSEVGLRAGTAGWTNPYWARSGVFYPKGLKSAEGRLQFYTRNFNLVEVDSSFYHLPSRRNAELWVARTPPDFLFNVKAFGAFTKHSIEKTALPKDLADEMPRDLFDKNRISSEKLPDEVMDELWNRFADALLPLHEAGKLGVILFQFPKWFPRRKSSLEWLAALRSRLPLFRIAVEFRQHSWLDEAHAADTLDFLRREKLIYVTVDEPQGYASSVPLLPAATGDIAIFRLHGRNTSNWDRRGAGVEERFRYSYPVDELQSFVPVVAQLKQQAPEVHLVFNNCYEDYAIRNIRQLLGLMAGRSPD